MKPEKREPVKREPLKQKPEKSRSGPAGVSKTRAKRDRGAARAQKRKQMGGEQARRDALGAPKPVGDGLVWEAKAPAAGLTPLTPPKSL